MKQQGHLQRGQNDVAQGFSVCSSRLIQNSNSTFRRRL